MNLLEYQAHELFNRYGLNGLQGLVAESTDDVVDAVKKINTFPLVLKAQVPIGGRGKAGGVRLVHSISEAEEVSATIFSLHISEFPVKQVFVVPAVDISKEMYMSLVLDRTTRKIVILFSEDGGMDINTLVDQDKSRLIRFELDPFQEIRPHMIWYIISRLSIPIEFKALFDLTKRLFRLMKEQYCLLVEVNPLILDNTGKMILLDGKISIDDNALAKLPDYLILRNDSETNEQVVLARQSRLLFIPVNDQDGDIGIISNGSGMIMSSIDLISQAGGIVRSALDLGGGATSDRVAEAIKVLLFADDISILFINIFGGITRCDEIVQGVITAYTSLKTKTPLVLRLEGTNKEEGLMVLKKQDSFLVKIADDLNHGVQVIMDLLENFKGAIQ